MSQFCRFTTALGALATLGFLTMGPTLAQSGQGYRQPPRAYNPAYSGVPNVPDDRGCVKWCSRDSDPCDPPAFKRADGRCNLFD